MKKIAFITPSIFTFGGEQRVVSMIASELTKEYDVTIYTTDRLTDKDKCPFHLSDMLHIKHFLNKTGRLDWNLRRIIRVLNRKTGCFNTERMAQFMCDMYYPPKKREELIKDINDNQYDVVIGVSGYNSILLGLIADRIKAKTVGWQHNSYEAYFETPGLYYWNQYYMFATTVRRLDRCFVLNSYIGEKYKEHFDVDCDVLYNPRSFKSEQKATLNEPLFVACGEFNYRKGFDYLIESYCKYKKKAVSNSKTALWKLMMLGDGKERPKIEAKIAEYGLQEDIILTGNVNNVQKYMLDASCFVLSSRWEGFPMVGTEALEIGLPIVSFDISAMSPLVSDGVEGLLVEAYDCDAFAEAMLKISIDSGMRYDMGQNAIEKSKEFSIEQIIKQWLTILQEMG